MIAFFGLILGIILGIAINVDIPNEYSMYFTVILLISLDSIFSSIRLILRNNFDGILSLILFLGNVFIGIMFILLSRKLGIDIQFAIYFVFAFRIILNFSQVLNLLYYKFLNRNRGSVKDEKC